MRQIRLLQIAWQFDIPQLGLYSLVIIINLYLLLSSYETENGIKAEETGSIKKASSPEASDVIVAQGGFSYTAPDGTVINLNYIADDDNGFKPEVNIFSFSY